MKIKTVSLALLMALVLLTQPLLAAVTVSETSPVVYPRMTVYTATVTMSATGSVTMRYPINGLVHSVETDPGDTAPTDDYDITLTDANGYDIMGGTLANRDTATTERTSPMLNGDYTSVPTSGVHTITVSNNSESGATVVLKIFVYDFRK